MRNLRRYTCINGKIERTMFCAVNTTEVASLVMIPGYTRIYIVPMQYIKGGRRLWYTNKRHERPLFGLSTPIDLYDFDKRYIYYAGIVKVHVEKDTLYITMKSTLDSLPVKYIPKGAAPL